MPRTLSLRVVGVEYPNADGGNRRFEIILCVPGEPVELRLEPTNPADPNAVAVFSARDVQIGYLTAERAPWIGSMIRAGRAMSAVFQDEADWGAVIRLALDGAEIGPLHRIGRHTQPPLADFTDPDPDFYPDEMPPDE